MQQLSVRTQSREELVDITRDVQGFVDEQSIQDAVLMLYCPHTTGAVTINEGADPAVQRDIAVNMGKLVPRQGDYRHAEGNSDAHIKSSLFGACEFVAVEGGKLQLGTWQHIFFCEFDGPRTRKLWVKVLGA
jgi:secondary thiamine-phosphate synthase enzyme